MMGPWVTSKRVCWDEMELHICIAGRIVQEATVAARIGVHLEREYENVWPNFF